MAHELPGFFRWLPVEYGMVRMIDSGTGMEVRVREHFSYF